MTLVWMRTVDAFRPNHLNDDVAMRLVVDVSRNLFALSLALSQNGKQPAGQPACGRRIVACVDQRHS